MGSMLKADSERRELVRERRQARIGAQAGAPGRSRAQAGADERVASGGVADPARGAGAGRRGA